MLISVDEGFFWEGILTLNARGGQARYHKKSSRGRKSNRVSAHHFCKWRHVTRE
jgi:hypothetical protein